MANRYDEETKKKVIDFVATYNSKHGRGGLSAASKKFSINPISITRWIEKAGQTTSRSQRGTSTKKTTRKKKPNSIVETLNQMSKLQNEIDALKSEISVKEAQFEQLKKNL